jgi:CRISPR-associated protein (TIGR02584 family)
MRPDRHIVVCLAGLSPAVVTETLYALAVKRRPPVVPDEVYILTTAGARASVMRALLGKRGAIRALALELGLPPGRMRCTNRHLVVLGAGRRRLPDIRTSADSQVAGKAIAGFLAGLKRHPEVALHCSVAGGRKTMGVLLALALQLVGRPGDRLYHVLVNEPFEHVPEFFFPSKVPRRFWVGDRWVDSRTARVELAEIPFVRLGSVSAALSPRGGSLSTRSAQVEAAVFQRFASLHLTVDEKERRIRVNGRALTVAPQDFVLFAFYASLRAGCQRCRAGEVCETCSPSDDELYTLHRSALLGAYDALRPLAEGAFVKMLGAAREAAEHRYDFDAWLRQSRSRLRRRLREAGLPVELCAIQRHEVGGVYRHGLAVASTAIEILSTLRSSRGEAGSSRLESARGSEVTL